MKKKMTEDEVEDTEIDFDYYQEHGYLPGEEY